MTVVIADDAIWRFELDLSNPFYALDVELDPETDRAAIEAGVDGHLTNLDLSEPAAVRDDFVARTLATLDDARRQNAIGAALLLDVADDGLPVEAYLLMFCVEGADAADPTALDALAGSLGKWNERDIGRRATRIVDLNGRPAVRYEGFALLDPDHDPSHIVAVIQYWVPVPGTGTQYLLSCWTPHIDAADELFDLFDAVAEGVTVTVPS
ncbi:MAG: hypothetical protein ACRD29_06485 [Acidimicrobiales bacterium]